MMQILGHLSLYASTLNHMQHLFLKVSWMREDGYSKNVYCLPERYIFPPTNCYGSATSYLLQRVFAGAGVQILIMRLGQGSSIQSTEHRWSTPRGITATIRTHSRTFGSFFQIVYLTACQYFNIGTDWRRGFLSKVSRSYQTSCQLSRG